MLIFIWYDATISWFTFGNADLEKIPYNQMVRNSKFAPNAPKLRVTNHQNRSIWIWI